MFTFTGGIQAGSVNVMTSEQGGLSSEQVTDLAMDKIMKVSETAPPEIKQQAEAFRTNVRNVVYHYIQLARQEERATIARRMDKIGNSEMADLVRRI